MAILLSLTLFFAPPLGRDGPLVDTSYSETEQARLQKAIDESVADHIAEYRAGLDEETPVILASFGLSTESGWFRGLQSDQRLYLTRLVLYECRGMAEARDACALSVLDTVFLRTKTHYLSNGSIYSTLDWNNDGNWQFPPGVTRCGHEIRCIEGYVSSATIEWADGTIDVYLAGERGPCSGFHYSSVPEWPSDCEIRNSDGEFIAFFDFWNPDPPAPADCEFVSGVNNGLDWPVASRKIVGRHQYSGHSAGVDIEAALRAAIVAVHDGYVLDAGFSPVYGNYLILDNGAGMLTLYAHMGTVPFPPIGEGLMTGDPIGTVGSTGMSDGPHLHFEVVRYVGDPFGPDAQSVNPVPYLCGVAGNELGGVGG